MRLHNSYLHYATICNKNFAEFRAKVKKNNKNRKNKYLAQKLKKNANIKRFLRFVL